MRRIYLTLILTIVYSLASAETLYVTDRILLGIHSQASETSPVIKTIPSGTPVEVTQKQDSFTKIKLSDGTEGWVSANYLKKEKPATSELDTVYAKLQQAQETNKKLSEELNKLEREIQVRRDEVSNSKTTIKGLRSALKEAGSDKPVVDSAGLDEANTKIKELEEKITQLEKEKTEVAIQSGSEAVVELEKLQNLNKEYNARIEAALANLQGETVPSAAELAAIRPSFPVWYWLLLVALFVVGVVSGIFYIDYQHRRKHGGFRI